MRTIFLLLLIRVSSVFAQAPVIEWQRCYGGSSADDAHSVQQTLDGGYILLGTTTSTNGNVTGYHPGTCSFGDCNDFWVVKVDSFGNLQWQKCLGGTGDELGNSIIQFSANSFTLTGWSESVDNDVIGNHGLSDAWVLSLDGTGSTLGSRCIGGTNRETFTYNNKTIDNGNVFIGSTGSLDGDVVGFHGGIGGDIWLLKTDSAFNLQGQRCIGGSDQEHCRYIQQTFDSGYFIVGYSNSTDGDITAFSHGGEDYWICKLDSAFNIVWQKSYGGSLDDIARSAKETRDGGFIVLGSSMSTDGDVIGTHGNQDYWVIKTDSAGNLQWQRCLGGSQWDDAYSIDTTLDGGFVIAGGSVSNDGDVTGNHSPGLPDYWVVQLDSFGNIMWQKSIGGSDIEQAQAIATTRDGGCILLGYTFSNDGDALGNGNHGGGDFWAVKLSNPNVGLSSSLNTESDFCCHINQASKNLEISFYSTFNERTQLQLFDITGRLLFSKSFMVTHGFNKQEEKILDMSGGVYVVCLLTESGTFVKKKIVQ
ncbi:lipoprotein [soil metagenome]